MLSKRTLSALLVCILAMCIQMNAFAESVVNVGSGSYASEPPMHENYYRWWDDTTININQFSKNPTIYVSDNETRPIPTNDWWTDLIFRQYGGMMWSYPQAVQIETFGFSLFHPTEWNAEGSDMIKNDPLVIKGDGFNPEKAIAKDWTDWTVTARMPDGAKYMDITMAHGIPMTWVEINGFNPRIETVNGAKYFNDSGASISFPYTGDHLGIEYGGKFYGIHAPDNTNFSFSGNAITAALNGPGKYLVISVLPSKADLSYYHRYAYSVPRNTTVNWNYRPAAGLIDISWNINTINLKGGAEKNVIQGFIPHQYKDSTKSFQFNGKTYSIARGIMQCAVGTSFNFSYNFSGIIPHFPSPVTNSNDEAPYDYNVMYQLISKFAEKVGYGGDTYWGGKDLVLYAKYTLMAKEVNHPAYEQLKAKTRAALEDWLTYTPGEEQHYFAYYPKWKALIGFDESYGSYAFTDNHFHYGYYTHAAALYGMVDKDFLNKYRGMLTLIAKQYANWDRNDSMFPFLRTMDPWIGHSYAGGESSPGGNNQESSSEAMQSWIGLYLLGNVLEDNAMRDAGAFGYVSESRATMQYWFNKDNDVFPSGYKHDIVGILWNGGNAYGTYFGDHPAYIYGIQWLPIAPGFNYLINGYSPSRAAQLYDGLLAKIQEYGVNIAIPRTEQWIADKKAKGEDTYWDELSLQDWRNITADGRITEAEIGGDWTHVVLGYRSIFDPGYTANKFSQYWKSNNKSEYDVVRNSQESGLTYYYSHALQNYGMVQWNYHMSIPTGTAYYNSKTGQYTYVVYNPKSITQACTVYRDGVPVLTFDVPANTLLAYNPSADNNFYQVSGKVEAENYSNMHGVQIEGCSEGGNSVGYIDAGDWMDYNVNVAASGTYTVEYRVSSPANTGKIQLISGDGVLATVEVPNTNGWQNWATVSTTVKLNQGAQTLKLKASSGGYNINWFSLTLKTAQIPGKIEAEDFDNMNGVQNESCSEGTQNVAYIDTGDWMDYNVNVSASGTYTVEYRISSPADTGKIQLISGDSVLATTAIPSTNGWQNWSTVSERVNLNAGNQTLRLRAEAGGFNLNHIKFIGESTTRNVALKASINGQYVSAEDAGNSPLIANRGAVGTWETFQLIDLGNNQIALKSMANNMYVSADTVELKAIKANVGTFETFELVPVSDGRYALKCVGNGNYVAADDAGRMPLVANRTSPGAWEEFEIINQ